MKKRVSQSIVYCVVLLVVLSIVVYADGYEQEGEENWSGSTPVEEGGEEGDVDWDDAVEEGEGANAEYDSATDPGYSLYMELRLYCHDSDRDGENGGKFVVNDLLTDYGHLYVDDYDLDDTSYPLVPYNTEFELPTDFAYEALFESINGYYEWVYQNEQITITTSSTDTFENAKLYRFEGTVDENYLQWNENGCVPYVGVKNTVDFTGDSPYIFDVLGKLYTQEELSAGETIQVKYDDDIGHNIEWDDNSDDCTAIGGAWNDDYSGENYACCGDDRMWFYNRAVNEEDDFTLPDVSDDDL